jgi:predicted transcriptional regulator
MSPKRSREMLVQITDELYERILASPGGAMSKFAEELGREVTELQVPIAMLKKQKRVRTIGVRQSMRYFPVPA